MKRDNVFWPVTAIVSAPIHAIFCVQAVLAAVEGGMVLNQFFMFLFKPHVMLIFFLPPAYPIDLSGGGVSVDWLRFTGKLTAAYPASLFYAWLLTKLWYARKKKHQNAA